MQSPRSSQGIPLFHGVIHDGSWWLWWESGPTSGIFVWSKPDVSVTADMWMASKEKSIDLIDIYIYIQPTKLGDIDLSWSHNAISNAPDHPDIQILAADLFFRQRHRVMKCFYCFSCAAKASSKGVILCYFALRTRFNFVTYKDEMLDLGEKRAAWLPMICVCCIFWMFVQQRGISLANVFFPDRVLIISRPGPRLLPNLLVPK